MTEIKKTNVLFVCFDSLHRSLTCEAVFRKMAKEANLEDSFTVDSAGYEGKIARKLRGLRLIGAIREYNIDISSRGLTLEDFDNADIVLGMTDNDFEKLEAFSPEPSNKIHKLSDFLTELDFDHIPDPRHPRHDSSIQTEEIFDIIEDACTGLLKHLAGT